MKLNEEIENVHIAADALENADPGTTVTNIISFWPLIRAVLKVVMIFTNNRVDAKINVVIAVGDAEFAVLSGK